MRRRLFILGAALCGCGGVVWATQQGRTLYVNGQRSAQSALVHEGEVYVPLSSLRAAGAQVTLNEERVSIQFIPLAWQRQLALHEGVDGEYVSNGTWRVKVGAVRPARNPFGRGQGHEVEIEFHNVSPTAHSLHGSGLANIQLVDNRDAFLHVGQSSFPARYQNIAPAGHVTNRLIFGVPRGTTTTGTPQKLLITFRPWGGRPALKGFRIHLNAR